MKFILTINLNDDDGVPTCEELGALLKGAGATIITMGKQTRVADNGPDSGRVVTPDGRHVGDWRVE